MKCILIIEYHPGLVWSDWLDKRNYEIWAEVPTPMLVNP